MKKLKLLSVFLVLLSTTKIFIGQDATSLRYLQYLNFMSSEIGLTPTFTTDNCAIFDSAGTIRSCNRISNNAVPTAAEIEQIKLLFGSRPFTWFVDDADTQTKKILEDHRLVHMISFPAMTMTLGTIQQQEYGVDIVVKAINAHTTDELPQCIDIIARSFGTDVSEFTQIIDFCIRHIKPDAMTLYVAYYQGLPAAVGMTLQHNTTATLHWISTLPEYRRKGLGYAIIHKALVTMQEAGCTEARLVASALGKSLYEQMGFKEYSSYAMYGNF